MISTPVSSIFFNFINLITIIKFYCQVRTRHEYDNIMQSSSRIHDVLGIYIIVTYLIKQTQTIKC